MYKFPLTPYRKIYSAINQEASWHYHKMESGNLDGKAPQVAGSIPEETEPVASAGKLEFVGLEHGGLFKLEGDSGLPIIVEAADGFTSGTLVDKAGVLIRNIPTTFPFTVSPGEYIKVSSGTKVGFLMKLATGGGCL